MAKKRSWFNLVKRFFISDAESKPEKKEKRKKWVFWGKFKIKRRLPSIAAPPSSPPKEATTAAESLDKEEPSKNALDVALASAAAAEAAVAAAHLAAEVVWFSTGVSQSNHQCQKETEQLHSIIEDQAENRTAHSTQQDVIKIQELAAIKIQTAFRAYLAKIALRALKGIVKLQAIIRGRNVRRQAINTLKCLQSIVNIQSQVQARRIQMAGDENRQFENLRDKIIKMDANSQRIWDGSILTKEESKAVYLSKKEAAIKRERIKEYAFSHREKCQEHFLRMIKTNFQNSAETDRSKVNGRFKNWLEQWVDNQVAKSKELEDLDTVVTSNPKPRVEYKGKPLKLKTLPRHYHIEGLDSPVIAPRRSFHRKQSSLGEDNSPLSGSPVIPTYMATTESAKAKSRSMSSPKLRPGSYDAYSDSYSPSKNRLPSTTSTQISGSVKVLRPSVYQQRSPSFKGLPSPVKSCRTLKDLSIDSDCSFRTWDPQSTFR